MASNATRDEIAAEETVLDELREDGLTELAAFCERARSLSDLSRDDFYAALVENYVIRLRNPDEEIQYTTTKDGDLMQIRDKGRTGEFGRPFGACKHEILDHLFSGEYEVTLRFPEDSAFEVAE